MARFSGQVSVAQMKEFLKTVCEDGRIGPDHLRLSDLRGMALASTAAEVQEFARLTGELDRRLPCSQSAILVSRDIDFGRSRQFIAYLEDGQDHVGVFRSAAEAIAWLGLPEELGDPFAGDDWAATDVA